MGSGLGARIIKLERRHPEFYEPPGLKALSDLELIDLVQDAEGIPRSEQTDDFNAVAEQIMAEHQERPFFWERRRC
jgi:hypothetical protein